MSSTVGWKDTTMVYLGQKNVMFIKVHTIQLSQGKINHLFFPLTWSQNRVLKSINFSTNYVIVTFRFSINRRGKGIAPINYY